MNKNKSKETKIPEDDTGLYNEFSQWDKLSEEAFIEFEKKL